jgi:hypothetical protein
MPKVEFEPTIPAFEQAKTVLALDRAATVIGQSPFTLPRTLCRQHCGEIYPVYVRTSPAYEWQKYVYLQNRILKLSNDDVTFYVTDR